MQSITKFSCTACGGESLCYGYLGISSNVFVPSGVYTVGGFRTRSFVCLNCGYVGQYIPKGKIVKLKQKLREDIE
jgi:hypothetical protein